MSLAPWLQGLPDPERMRATDRWAIEEQRIPGLELMERAGQGLADLVLSVAPDGPIAVVCGKGNNGGDGYVAARLLREAGRAVRVLAVAPVSELSGDARANAERVDGVEPFDAARLADCSVAVDALLGTGFSGTPHGAVADAIDALNDAALPIVAADVPSGVDAASGLVEGRAIRARATATFAAAKPGLWINPGKSHAGTVRVIDIGIPQGAPVAEPDVALIADAELLALLSSRAAGWTKFTSGHVLVAGGSRGLTGAPTLASEAAQRAGAGYVTACVPASAQPILAQRLLEAMTRALPEDDGAHTAAGVDEVLELAQRGGALVVGPGLGRSDGAFAFARDLVARAEVAVVLDADGLNAHAGDLGCPGRPHGADDPHAARGRARAPARGRVVRRGGPPPRARARRGGAGAGDRGPQGRRHPRGRPRRPGRRQPRCDGRAGHGRHRRRPQRGPRRRALAWRRALHRGVRRRAPARARGHPRRPREGRRRRHRPRRHRGAALRPLASRAESHGHRDLV